jgi:hypothetical protein
MMTRKLLLSAALGVALLFGAGAGSSGSARAATLVLGPGAFDPITCAVPCNGSFGPLASESGVILDTYSFITSIGALFSAGSATNSSAGLASAISGFTLRLFLGTPGSGTLVATATPTFFSPTFQSTGGFGVNIDPGTYYLQVDGTTGGGSTTYAGSYSFSAAVPAPIAGAGVPALLLATGFLLSLYRRRKSAAAA